MNYTPDPARLKPPPRLSPVRSPVRRSAGDGASSQRRGWILTAVLLSLLLHGGAFGLIGLMARHKPPPPPAEGSVELLMVEQKGATASAQTPTPSPPPAARPSPPPPKPRPSSAAKPSSPPPLQTADKGEPVPASSPTAPADAAAKPSQTKQADAKQVGAKQVEAKPTPQASPTPPTPTPPTPTPPNKPSPPTPPAQAKAPVFDFNGTDSLSNAEVQPNDHVLPASPDDRFRNRPPPYPAEAARLREEGMVTVLIHVGANGLATGVDITQTSGYPVLDRAAVTAAMAWRFHPAISDGRAVPFDLPFRFDFRAN